MFDFARTRIESSREIKVHSLYPITSEGLILVHDMENGEGVVRMSSGLSNNEIVAGFSLAQNMSATQAIMVEDLVAPSTLTVVLQRAPTAGAEMLVKANGVAKALTTDFTVAGNVVTLVTIPAGAVLQVVYRYNLLAAEAQMLYGDQPIGPTAAAFLGSVSVITKGVVYTNNFDTSADWAGAVDASTPVKAGANGRLQLGGTGGKVDGWVAHAPSADVPFLGVYINA